MFFVNLIIKNTDFSDDFGISIFELFCTNKILYIPWSFVYFILLLK